jgi:hypothetical protein
VGGAAQKQQQRSRCSAWRARQASSR